MTHASSPRRQLIRARIVGLLDDTYRLFLCALVGAVTGCVAILFRAAVGFLFHHMHAAAHALETSGHPLGGHLVLVSGPAIGGFVVGLLVYRLVRVQAGHGVPAVITAAAADRPMADWRMGFKAGTSVITIGSGGSAGPEGPIVELGAVVGSFAWKIFKLPGTWVRTMMGCGAAAGIAAVFNVPVGGVIFVLDVMMRDYSLRSLIPLMIASVTASTVAAGPLGLGPAFHVPTNLTPTGYELICSPLLGLAAGVASAIYIRASFRSADLWKRAPIPVWLRPAIGGVCVGLIGLITLRAIGEGYDAIEAMLAETPLVAPLIGLALARIVATACTLGSGATGGAFAPSLVIGAAVGLASAAGLAHLIPDHRPDATAFALMGMAALIAGTFQAPLSGLVIAHNLSHWNPQLLVPLMCASVMSAWLTGHLARASIYELGLLREGVDLQASRSLQTILAGRAIGGIVQRGVATVPRNATLGQLIDVVSRTHQEVFPVMDDGGRVVGIIRLSELRTILRESQLEHSVIAADLMEPLRYSLRPSDSLAAAWEAFNRTSDDQLLVLRDGDARPLLEGLISRADVVRHVKWG